jgi:hypothetical protein
MNFYKSEATAAERRWPFACVDDTDGKTAEPSLTFSAGELQISKNGAAYANVAGTVTELTDGTYYYEATVGELDTNGFLLFKIEKAGVRLTIMHVGQVVSYDAYDQTALGLTSMPANVTSWNSSAVATPTVAGVPEVDVTHWIGTAAATPTVAGVPEIDVTHWNGTAVATPTTAGVPRVDVKAMEANVLTATAINADAITAAKIADSAIDRATFAQDAKDMFGELRRNTATAGGATTITLDGSASAVDDFYNGVLIVLVGGTGSGQFRTISDYVGATKVATVSTWSTNPDATSVFVLFAEPASTSVDTAAIADAVWDEALAGHATAGTSGKKLSDLSTTAPLDAAATAAAVWNAAYASYNSAGTFGEFVQDLVAGPTATQIRDAILDYSHDTGLTIKGFFRRLDALAAGKATGLRGTVARYFMRDGTTEAIEATQDVSLGTRQAADVTGSEA